MNNLELVFAKDLPERLIRDFEGAKKRISLQSMDFDSRDNMRDINESIGRAARRGVLTTLHVDTSFLHTVYPLRSRLTLSSLKSDGVRVETVGDRLGAPIIGRCHGKSIVVDDTVYFGGGVNLVGEGFDFHDLMLRTKDKAVADTLVEIQQRSIRGAQKVDYTKELSLDNRMLVDGGRMGESLIRDTAVALAQQAAKAWYLSQLSPDMNIVRALIGANTDTMYKYNHPGSVTRPSNKLAMSVDSLNSKVANAYIGSRKIHAKVFVVQAHDGKLSAITGSHNLASSGVAFGTREYSLLTADQNTCHRLIDFIEQVK